MKSRDHILRKRGSALPCDLRYEIDTLRERCKEYCETARAKGAESSYEDSLSSSLSQWLPLQKEQRSPRFQRFM